MLVFFLLSLLGIFALCRFLFRTDSAFVPLIALSGTTLVLFLTAIFDCLSAGSCVLFVGGVVCFGLFLLFERSSFSYLLSPGFWAFALISVAIAVKVYGTFPDQYDNYTHWALMMKTVYQHDGLPVPGDLVTFVNYPPATALFGYYLMRILRFGEDIMMTSQGMLVAAALAALFGGTTFRRPLRILLTAAGTVAMAVILPHNLISLYVDALLGYLAAACVMLSLYETRSVSRGHLTPLPIVLSVLMLTKQSGILFVLFCAIADFVLRLLRPVRGRFWRAALALSANLGLPLLMRFLFTARTDAVYGAETAVQFDTTYGGALSGLAAKSETFLRDFPRMFHGAITNLTLDPVRLGAVLAVVTVLCILLLLVTRQWSRSVILLALTLVFAAVYVGGVYFMYFAWMPEDEALGLASFDRYISSGVIFWLGMLLAVWLMPPRGDHFCPYSVGILLLAAPIALSIVWGTKAPEATEEKGLAVRIDAREELDEAYRSVADLIPPEPTRVYVIDDRIEPGYYYYIMRYMFMRRYVWPLELWCIDEDHWGETAEDCLILVLHSAEMTEAYLKRSFGVEDLMPGIYEKRGGKIELLRRLDGLGER